MSTAALASSRGIEMPSLTFGSPGDWQRWWLAKWADFLEILHEACNPNGMEDYLEQFIYEHGL